MKKVLLIEDEEKLRKVIVDYGEKQNLEVIQAGDGVAGLDLFFENENDIGLVILDIMMPKKNGWEVCKEIREVSDVYILMLTANSQDDDFIKGYELGANSYVSKPFSTKVLIAKIMSIIKPDIKDYIYKELRVDFNQRKIYLNEENISVTNNEFRLIEYMTQNNNIALKREKILDQVWGYDYDGTDRAIDNCIKRLRGKVRKENLPINSIRGFGYIWEDKL